jgi:Ca-activated chloride channel family protein
MDRPLRPSGKRKTPAYPGPLFALIAACVAFFSSAGEVCAQRPEVDDETLTKLRELHYREQEHVRLVQLPVVVTNRHGRTVRGLVADDFKLFEDWIPQTVRYISTEATEPISVAFLLDLSGSMRQPGKLDEAKLAIRRFVDALRPEDRFGLIGFADDQVTWITEFTSDRDQFVARLDDQRAYGQTALYDAIAATPELVDDGTEGRKAIVLITDGVDNASTMNTLRAVQLARSVDVPIYAIGLSSLPPKTLAKGSVETVHRTLELFSRETGGRLFSVHRSGELAEAVRLVEDELRSVYLIGYFPTRTRWDDTFRRIKLEVTKRGAEVRTRQGYYARP